MRGVLTLKVMADKGGCRHAPHSGNGSHTESLEIGMPHHFTALSFGVI